MVCLLAILLALALTGRLGGSDEGQTFDIAAPERTFTHDITVSGP